MIESAAEFVRWFDAENSAERNRVLLHSEAAPDTWLAILDQSPRAALAVARNATIPLVVLEHLRTMRDYKVQWLVRSRAEWQGAHREDAWPFEIDIRELVEYDLTALERAVLREGLHQWGGPSHCTEELAIAMGFDSTADLHDEGSRIAAAVEAARPMTHRDWTRAMIATEIVFVSNVVGAGIDWATVTGIDDAVALRVIRTLQSHLVVVPVAARVGGDSAGE